MKRATVMIALGCLAVSATTPLAATAHWGAWQDEDGRTVYETTNPYGDELKNEFAGLEVQLTSVYGRYDKLDFLWIGSIWTERKDWMASVLNKDRVLIAYWSADARSDPKNSIKAIQLDTSALSSGKGYISLRYEFDNISKCLDSRHERASKAL